LKSIVVEAPPERAFTVFADEMATWWPPDHHILESELAEMVFEPRAGGRIFDRGVDGSECQWGRVLAYEPPHRVGIAWDINREWELEPDHSKSSEVEVRFVPEDESRTRVELEHRNLDRHGEGWEGVRDAVGGPGGWGSGLEVYAARVRDEGNAA